MSAKVHLDRAHLHRLLQQMKRIREFEARRLARLAGSDGSGA